MKTRRNYLRLVPIVVLLFAALFVSPSAAYASGARPPVPIVGPRLSPPPIPHTSVIDNRPIWNDLIVPSLSLASRQADIADDGRYQEAPGRGIRQTTTDNGSGLTLYASPGVCNDFNQLNGWAAEASPPSDVWTDHYASWGAFAVDDGGFYQAKNVVFSREQAVGPGDQFGKDQYSIKIASHQPYAAGFGSPPIVVPPGAVVNVSVKYLIFDHDTHGWDFDWASLGLKADAAGDYASYVNGYVRGEWAELSHRVIAGDSGEVMVLLQGHSPAALNSNIYFDDVRIAVNGEYLAECIY